MLTGVQPASAASCYFFCKPPPTTAPKPPPTTAPPAPKPAPAPVSAPAAFDPAAATQHLLDLTNAERAAKGVGPLTMRDDATAIAQGQSAAMAAAGSIWHNENYLTQETRRALGAKMLGENVGMGGDIDQIHRALMNSPGHAANILEPAFSVVGMATVRSNDGVLYITQDFVQTGGSTPRPAAVKKVAAPAPTKPRPAVARKPKVARTTAASTAAPATTAAPTTTAAPATTTTTVAPQPDSSVLAVQAAPAPAPAHGPSGPSPVFLVALGLIGAIGTGAVRLRRRRPQPTP